MSLSLEERNRRYTAIRELMEKDELDCLVIVSRDTYFTRGNTRYVTNYGNYMGEEIVLLPIEGDPVIIAVEGFEEAIHRGGWVQDYIGSFNFFERINRAKQELTRFDRGNRIGIVGTAYISAPVYSEIQAQFPNSITDADWILKEVRSIKSLEEIEMMRLSAAIVDKAFPVIRDIIQPGISDFKIYGEVKRLLHEMGCEYSMEFIKIHSALVGLPWGDVLKAKDMLGLDITPAYKGYYSQLLVALPVGEYPPEIQKMVPVWAEALSTGVNLLRSEIKVPDVDYAISTVIREYGYEPMNSRLGHSIGLDVNDGLAISPDDNTELKSGMTLALHPGLSLKDVRKNFHGGYTYLITDAEPVKLNKVSFVSTDNSSGLESSVPSARKE